MLRDGEDDLESGSGRRLRANKKRGKEPPPCYDAPPDYDVLYPEKSASNLTEENDPV